MQDAEIISLLSRLRRPSLITRDRDFCKRHLTNDRYCLAFLDVPPLDVARYARRMLRHPDFKMWSQRKGCVIRVTASGIHVWRRHVPQLLRYRWVD
jgi:hypothetical protein